MCFRRLTVALCCGPDGTQADYHCEQLHIISGEDFICLGARGLCVCFLGTCGQIYHRTGIETVCLSAMTFYRCKACTMLRTAAGIQREPRDVLESRHLDRYPIPKYASHTPFVLELKRLWGGRLVCPFHFIPGALFGQPPIRMLQPPIEVRQLQQPFPLSPANTQRIRRNIVNFIDSPAEEMMPDPVDTEALAIRAPPNSTVSSRVPSGVISVADSADVPVINGSSASTGVEFPVSNGTTEPLSERAAGKQPEHPVELYPPGTLQYSSDFQRPATPESLIDIYSAGTPEPLIDLYSAGTPEPLHELESGPGPAPAENESEENDTSEAAQHASPTGSDSIRGRRRDRSADDANLVRRCHQAWNQGYNTGSRDTRNRASLETFLRTYAHQIRQPADAVRNSHSVAYGSQPFTQATQASVQTFSQGTQTPYDTNTRGTQTLNLAATQVRPPIPAIEANSIHSDSDFGMTTEPDSRGPTRITFRQSAFVEDEFTSLFFDEMEERHGLSQRVAPSILRGLRRVQERILRRSQYY
ncbi:Benzoate 4-monooxygenase [Paramyrothecium foliicola]|nr:Benzoate 4-monooxygenase [Paramyrothecium foliicola]